MSVLKLRKTPNIHLHTHAHRCEHIYAHMHEQNIERFQISWERRPGGGSCDCDTL